MVPNRWPESSKVEIKHGSVNHLPKSPVNHKTWLTAFSAWLTQGPSIIKQPSTITLSDSGHGQWHDVCSRVGLVIPTVARQRQHCHTVFWQCSLLAKKATCNIWMFAKGGFCEAGFQIEIKSYVSQTTQNPPAAWDTGLRR